MNQGRIWCVVAPTVGLPLLLGSVTVIALIVHASVLSNTTWFGGYWGGHAKAKAVAAETAAPSVAMNSPNAAAGFTISVAPVAAKTAATETAFLITVAPKAPVTASADTKSAGSADQLRGAVALAAPSAK